MKKILRLNADRLPRPIKARFEKLRGVALHRSVVYWICTDEARADVVFCPGADALPDAVCICIANEGDAMALGSLPLNVDFRVAALINALDVAAIRVLDQWDKRIDEFSIEAGACYGSQQQSAELAAEAMSPPPWARALACAHPLRLVAKLRRWIAAARVAQVEALP